MKIEIDIPEHHYNNIMAIDSINLGRAPYKGIIMFAINAIKRGKVLEQEPKTGHWISRWHAGHAFHFHVCSECNEEFSCDMETGISIDNYRYCPNCGAKMAESEDQDGQTND